MEEVERTKEREIRGMQDLINMYILYITFQLKYILVMNSTKKKKIK